MTRKRTHKWTTPDSGLRLPGREATLKRCVIKGCANAFWGSEDLKYCLPHRQQFVRLRSKPYKWNTIKEDFESERFRHEWDWKVVDENGRLVWAKDLAARYRRELIRRKNREW